MQSNLESQTRGGRWNRRVGWNGMVQWLVLLALLAPSLLGNQALPAAGAVRSAAQQEEMTTNHTGFAHIDPQIIALARSVPEQSIRIIVQKLGQDQQVEQFVQELGGEILANLDIIHAFSAEVPVHAIEQLATHPGIRWVSLDAPVLSSAIETVASDQVRRDEFSTISYSGNNGTVSWNSNWLESGETDGASNGIMRVVASSDCVTGNCLRIGAEGANLSTRKLTRSANLSGAGSATLSFSYRRRLLHTPRESMSIEISGNGGSTWTTLATYPLTGTDGAPVAQSFNISAYMSPNTQIRFAGTGTNVESYFFVDNIEIRAVPAVPNNYLATLRVGPVWHQGFTGIGIGVAVVDTGISLGEDFSQLPVRMKFCSQSCDNSTENDTYGHGSHVAGIIGGNGTKSGGIYKGIAPNAKLLSLKIGNEAGVAYESDAVAAMQWIYDNRVAHNIRVVNLSINSSATGSYHQSALNAAAEILWFNGIVVVASAGNTVAGGIINPVQAAPANDPFVITVGATYEGGTNSRSDDVIAPFSAAGTTLDGHVKPEIVAPGTDIFSVLSPHSSWASLYPNRASMNGAYFRLSGTSMSAPMVTGAIALLLQDEPHLTPDQVKYRLINTSSLLPGTTSTYLDINAAVNGTTTQSSNTGLVASQLLWTGSTPINWNSVNWNSVNWNSVNWKSVNWNSVNWKSVNWNNATVTEISQDLITGTLPADMEWELPAWSNPDESRQVYQLMIPSVAK